MWGHFSQGVALGSLSSAPLVLYNLPVARGSLSTAPLVLKNFAVALGSLSAAPLVLKNFGVALGSLSTAPLVLKNFAVARGFHSTAPLVLLCRITNAESIPHIPFIIRDIVAFEECPVFLLECFCAVVFALVGNVLTDSFHI